jgi:hypothetical protein
MVVLTLLSIALAVVGQRLIWRSLGLGKYWFDPFLALTPAILLFFLVLLALERDRLAWPPGGRVPALARARQARPEARPPNPAVAAARTPRPELRLVLVSVAAGLAVAAYAAFGGNAFTPLSTLTWLGSMAAFTAAFWQTDRRPSPSTGEPALTPEAHEAASVDIKLTGQGLRLRASWTVVALAAVMLVGAFFRFHRLELVPLEMTSDMAEKLLDVTDVLNGSRKVYFERNTGREPMQFYYTAVLTTLAGTRGVSFTVLKFGTALAGLLTIPFVYLLGKEAYGRVTGILAAALFGQSMWQVCLARVGLRFPFYPLFAVPTMYYALRCLKYNRRNDYLLLGLTFGLGLHGYTPFRIVALVLVVWLGLGSLVFVGRQLGMRVPRPRAVFYRSARAGAREGRSDERSKHAPADESGLAQAQPDVQYSNASPTDPQSDSSLLPTGQAAEARAGGLDLSMPANCILAALLAGLVFVPLLRYWADHPNVFWYRSMTRAGEVERQFERNPVQVFISNNVRALAMFNGRGQHAWISHSEFDPHFDYVMGGLLILGMLIALARLRARDWVTGLLLISVPILLLPSTLSLAFPIENPSGTRGAAAGPVVLILVALPLTLLWHLARSANRRAGTLLAGGSILVLLVLSASFAYRWYFFRYEERYRLSVPNATEIAHVMRGFADAQGGVDGLFLRAWPYWVDRRNVSIELLGDPYWDHPLEGPPEGPVNLEPAAAHKGAKLLITHPSDQVTVEQARAQWGEVTVVTYPSATPGKEFVGIWVIPRQ